MNFTLGFRTPMSCAVSRLRWITKSILVRLWSTWPIQFSYVDCRNPQLCFSAIKKALTLQIIIWKIRAFRPGRQPSTAAPTVNICNFVVIKYYSLSNCIIFFYLIVKEHLLQDFLSYPNSSCSLKP